MTTRESNEAVRRPPSVEDLKAAVRKQLRFIVNSGNMVAQGDHDEAVRVAVALRVLLHDTRSSHSLLSQLGWKDKLAYVNSLRQLELTPGLTVSLGTDTGEQVGQTFGLVVLVQDDAGGLRYAAPLDRDPVEATLPFGHWWNDKVLYSEGTPTFSRWDLIDSMAHHDGGAHLDPRGLTRQYETFKLRGAGIVSFQLPPDVTGLPETLEGLRPDYPGDAAAPTVLQIAWELVETLRRANLPDGADPN